MAYTRISDVIEPEIFLAYMQYLSTEQSALWRSGIVVDDPLIAKHAKSEGRTFNAPKWDDLGDDEANVGSDDPAETSTPLNIGAINGIMVKNFRNQSWGTMHLLSALLAQDPAQVIASRVADYWKRQLQLTLLSMLQGVLADNEAADSGDMVYDIATDDATAETDDELISAEAIIQAKATMGDAAHALTALAIHSVPYAKLQSLNLVNSIPDNMADIGFGTYMGYTLLVDDGLPVEALVNRDRYTL